VEPLPGRTIGQITDGTYDSELITNYIDQMEQFFVGLVDSNVGSIQVNHWRKKSLQFRVIIKLNNTPANVEMLQYIQLRLKIGKISVRPNHVLLLAFLDLILTVQKRGLTTKMKFLK
jgi:hypothetical protein